jgi:hypothetical protein
MAEIGALLAKRLCRVLQSSAMIHRFAFFGCFYFPCAVAEGTG